MSDALLSRGRRQHDRYPEKWLRLVAAGRLAMTSTLFLGRKKCEWSGIRGRLPAAVAPVRQHSALISGN
jgi:hypothetical protein